LVAAPDQLEHPEADVGQSHPTLRAEALCRSQSFCHATLVVMKVVAGCAWSRGQFDKHSLAPRLDRQRVRREKI
jgi:hypothetical protein